MNAGRDRDKAIDRLLQKSMAGRDSSAGNACPDAETVAAWVEGGLSRPETERIETHASMCARCQALLAVMAETAPDASVRALRERERWRGWYLRWLVPFAAAAAAVIIWVAVPHDERPALPAQANVELSKSAAAPPQREANDDRFNPQTARPQPPRAAREANAGAENKTASTGATERGQRNEDAPLKDKKESEQLDTLSAREAGAPPAPSSADAAQPRPALAETVARSRAAFRAGPVEIVSADPSVRWRIAAGGLVERTTNGGTAWQSVPTGIDADLTAGASPSASVCWLVGRAGTVLLSTDGRTWRRVPFPDMTDLTAVQATNALTATIITTDGRMFRTTDGGLTWAK